jgi:hypothetical protein
MRESVLQLGAGLLERHGHLLGVVTREEAIVLGAACELVAWHDCKAEQSPEAVADHLGGHRVRLLLDAVRWTRATGYLEHDAAAALLFLMGRRDADRAQRFMDCLTYGTAWPDVEEAAALAAQWTRERLAGLVREDESFEQVLEAWRRCLARGVAA